MMGCVESGQLANYCLSLQPEGRKSQYEKSCKDRVRILLLRLFHRGRWSIWSA